MSDGISYRLAAWQQWISDAALEGVMQLSRPKAYAKTYYKPDISTLSNKDEAQMLHTHPFTPS